MHVRVIPLVRLAEVGTVVLAIWMLAARAQSVAVSVRQLPQPLPLAGHLQLALLRLLAKVIQVDLGQGTQDGQHQLAPGRGEIELLLDGNK